jgi:glycosyltransferase involved in cell wall biosynthesis
MKLSVLMAVYDKESPEFLRQSLDSLVTQTLPADEIVIVEDGPLRGQLHSTLATYAHRLPIVLLPLSVHAGLGDALRTGLAACRGDLVARMDSDDLCVPERFRKQVLLLDAFPQVDVLGSAIAEFNEDPLHPHSIRTLPRSGEALLQFARFRNPLNHMTVMFRKSSVLAAGSYEPCPGFEDYHLWARMLTRGYFLFNTDEILVYARSGDRMQARRGGFTYLKRDIAFQTFLYRIGFVTASESIHNILLRAPVRITPVFVRSLCYSLFLRDRFVSGPRAGKLREST